ncbi:MAG: SLC13 family permease [Hyphomicrobiales bacterium]
MLEDGSVQMWATFAIIGVAIVFYVTERVSLEITSVGLIVALLLLFHFMPLSDGGGNLLISLEDILSGFASPALITILALLAIGQGLFQTGALEGPTRQLQELGANRRRSVLLVTLATAGAISAFLNNTPVVVMFIPIVSALSAKLGVSASKTLMPLSFITILGGMTTLIGSSTNILVAGLAARYGNLEIGFFDFVVPGLVLAALGGVYVTFIMPRLLRPGRSMSEAIAASGGRQFIAQITVTQGHPLDGAGAVAGLFPALKNMTVRLIQRGEHPILPPFEDITLRDGDVVIVAATRKALTETLTSKESLLTTDPEDTDAGPDAGGENSEPFKSGGLTLAEAVVAPGSRLIGRRIEESGLRSATGCIVLGIQRRSRMIRIRLSEIRLEPGDVILVLGTREDVRGLRLNHDLLLLEWSAHELPDITLAARAMVIFAGTVAAAASGLMPIVVAALLGAFAMVPAGCLNLRQASRAFDRKIYLLIGASLAMAASLEATGGAHYVAMNMVSALSGASTAVVLSALFLLIAVLTNVLSNHATAALFTPIAIDTAVQLNADPRIFVFAVILAANCSFATPMAYQTNLLVMGSGHYRFGDFLRAGTPLIFVLWLAYSLFAPWYYQLH